ncbi:MAG: hypothetical protein Q9160_007669 [Pyrenula sp. 1 TL-2023]
MASYDDGGFSQSRGDDDLFDDDFTPLEPSEQQTYNQPSNLDHSTEQLHNLSLDESSKPPPTTQYRGNNFRPRGPRGSNRGRTRGGRDRPNAAPTPSSTKSSLQQSKYAPAQPTDQKQPTKAPDSPQKPDEASPSTGPASPPPPTSTDQAPLDSSPDANAGPPPSVDDHTPASNAPSTSDSTSTSAPSAAATATSPRPPAVRGSRLLTGGPLRTKLTEAELTAKIATARVRSQQLSTAHARAEADAASFAERERVATEKREKERVNRRALEGERERNRERKMKALTAGGGREWDEGKDVQQQAGGRGRGYMRGVFGGVGRRDGEGGKGLGMENRDMVEGERGRGGGGRGGRGYRSRGGGGAGGAGRGRGRGGDNRLPTTSTSNGPTQQSQPDVSAQADFPSLPAGEKPKVETTKPPPSKLSAVQSTKAAEKKALETPISPGEGGSWADQVDRVEAAKGAS